MRYTKPALTFEQQAAQLLERGLEADRDLLIARLRSVSYYRLSGYWYPFRNSDDSFQDGASLDTIWNLYRFDRQLRLLIIDAIERAEIAIRTSLIYHLAHAHGPFGYTDARCLPNINAARHAKFLEKVATETERSQETFVSHFESTYGDSHKYLPIWMAAEIMTFGMLLTLFRGVDTSIKQNIANEYRVSDKVLESWLCTLNVIRNICAHHARIWNRELGYKPLIPRRRKHPEWHTPVKVPNNRVFGVLTILKYMMAIIAPQSRWQEWLEDLISQFPEVSMRPTGFPENWQECPIWKPIEN